MEALAECKPTTISEIARKVKTLRGKASRTTIRQRLAKLVEKGVVKRLEGKTPTLYTTSMPGGAKHLKARRIVAVLALLIRLLHTLLVLVRAILSIHLHFLILHVRAKYWKLMFKYHLWRKGVPKHVRNKLAETSYNRVLDSQLKQLKMFQTSLGQRLLREANP